MKKIGLLSLALVLALGALGVGYAMWSDEIVIDGTVNTGSVEISIVRVSQTYVYKNVTSRDIVMSDVPLQAGPGTDLLFVASATAEEDTSDPDVKKVTMNFTNIFPTPTAGPIVADVELHYTGTIPAHVTLKDEDVDPSIADYLVQRWWVNNGTGWVEKDIEGIQLHYCYGLYLEVYLDPDLLQRDGKDAQGVSGNFTKTVFVHQWNETP